MLLINPPLTKPSEPPGGLAYLAGALKEHNVKFQLLDLNLEGIRFLLGESAPADECMTTVHTTTVRRWSDHRTSDRRTNDRRTDLAMKNRARYLSALKQPDFYLQLASYKKAVYALNHLVALEGAKTGFQLSLANYEHKELSPLRSEDLIKMAQNPPLDPFYPYFEKRLSRVIEEAQPAMVGFSLTYLNQALCTFAMLGFIKKRYPALKLILGGGLVTSWLSSSRWCDPFHGLVDELVAGPGESYLLAAKGKKPTTPFYKPDFEAFCEMDYMAPGFILPVSGSRGCYWKKCAFCPEKSEDNPYRTLPAGRFVQDVQELVRIYNPVLIHFLDNALSPSHLQALMDEPVGRTWYGYTRMLPELTSLAYCRALKTAGCVMLKLGLESGDEDVLAHMQKGIQPKDVPLILTNLKEAGIGVYLYVLFGTPWETREAALRTRDFVAFHSENITFINAALFNLPLDAPEASLFHSRDFYGGDLSLYAEFDHPQGWNRREVREFMKKEWHRNRAIAAILDRTPPFFTSNHAPFCCF